MQLYLGNLAPEVDEPLLFELVNQLAPVASVRMPKHKIKQTPQGYGFAVFQSEADAKYVQEVLSASQIKLFGRPLKIGSAAHSAQPAKQTITKRIYVGNLDSELVDEANLSLPFEKFGKVEKVDIVRSEKCHAFVTMSKLESAEKAVAHLNNQYILNRIVKVEFER